MATPQPFKLAWISAGLIAAAFAVSLFMRGYDHIHYAPALALLGVAALGALGARDLAFPSSVAAVLVMALWGLWGIMASFSTIPFTSQISLVVFSALPLAFVATHLLAARSDILRPLAALACGLFAALGVAALVQIISGTGMTFSGRANGPFINPNSLASIMTIGLIALSGAAMGCNKRPGRMVLGTAALLAYAGLLATASRGGILAAALGMTILLLFNRGLLTRRSVLQMTGAAGAVTLLVPLLSGGGLWRSFAALLEGTAGASVTDRLALWQSAWQMMKDHIWTGTGPGTFSAYYPRYRDFAAEHSTGQFVHMDPLQMGVEMGVAAPLVVYALMIAVVIRTVSATLAAGDDRVLRLRILAPFAALLAVGLHAHICFPLYLMPVLIACGVLLGLWHGATHAALGQGVTILRAPPALVLGTGMTVLTALLALAATAAGGQYFMDRAAKQRDPQSYLETLARADRFAPPGFVAPKIEMAAINLRLIEGGRITSPVLRTRFLAETQELLSAARAWDPARADIDLLEGRRLMLDDAPEQAVTAWQAGLERNPMQFDIRRALAEYYRAAGQDDKARDVAAQGLMAPHPLAYRAWAAAFLKDARP